MAYRRRVIVYHQHPSDEVTQKAEIHAETTRAVVLNMLRLPVAPSSRLREEGIEPSLPVPKTDGLPLADSRIRKRSASRRGESGLLL